jgi:hypothetical protein
MERGDPLTAIVYMADSLLRVAKKAHASLDDGRPLKKPGDSEEGLTAIVFAAAAFEGFLNELGEVASGTGGIPGTDDRRVALLAEVLGEAEESKASTRLKYFLVGSVLQGRPFDRGNQPWQDLELLLRLRDAVIHLEPTRFSLKEGMFSMTGEKLVEQLRQRGLLPAFPADVKMVFLHWLSPRSVARWAINASVRATTVVLAALPKGQFKERILPRYSKDFVEITGPSSNDAEWLYENERGDV